jgi:ELWxxDGT repeat protein
VLLKDIWPGSGSGVSFQSGGATLGEAFFFAATDGNTGPELWKSDGTAAGTLLLKEILPGPIGSRPASFTVVNGTLFFSASGPGNRELWKSDGTAAGTVLVKDIRPGGWSSDPSLLRAVEGMLYFIADDSTGTVAGTVLVRDIWVGVRSAEPRGLTVVGGMLFFNADDSTHGTELWKSDGTAAGTVLVKDVAPGFGGSEPTHLTDLGGMLFFAANDSTHGSELWKSDGTAAGTVLVKDIYPGFDNSSPNDLTVLDGMLFFRAKDGTNGYELWKSDGTEAGTVLVKDIRPGSAGSGNFYLTPVRETLFFRANDGVNGYELWKSDGTTAGTVLIKDIRPGARSSGPQFLAVAGGTVFFRAFDGTTGQELWKSDGTELRTVLVRDIYRGTGASSPLPVAVIGGTPFFEASDGLVGRELWRTVAAPEIAVTDSTLDFDPPIVTVGDTSSVDLEIFNIGFETLAIQEVRTGSAGLRIDRAVPFDIAPGGTDTVTVFLEPRVKPDSLSDIVFTTNDPKNPSTSIGINADIRALEIARTRLIPAAENVPLGQNVIIAVSLAPAIRMERGHLFYRQAGTTVFDSIPLTRLDDDFEAIIPGEFVTESGLEYFVRVENSGITATDPPDAPQSVFEQAVEAPAAITTTPQPNSGDGFLNGRQIRVLVNIPTGAEFVGGMLHYRRGGETSYHEIDVQAGDPSPFAVIPDTVAGARGVEYWVEVTTQTRALTDPPDRPEENPFTIRVMVESLPFPFPLPTERYRMISIPLAMEGTILGSLDELGGRDATQWRMFGYWDNARGGYIELPNDTLASFEQGRAYWLITRRGGVILATRPNMGLSTGTGQAFTRVLKPGDWSMVGNPFAFAVAWDSVVVDTLIMADAEGVLVEPMRDGSGNAISVMEPFEGYWVRNLSASPVTLHIPPSPVQRQAETAPPIAGKREEWAADNWRIAICAFSGEFEDAHNYVGVKPGASSRWDRHDRFETPMSPGRSLSLYFPHVAWERQAGYYSADMRGPYEMLSSEGLSLAGIEENIWGHIWHFDVAKNFSEETAGDEVVLEFSGLESVPTGAKILLVDRKLERLIDLAKVDRYTFFQGVREIVVKEEDARFVLLVGGEDFIAGQKDELPRLPTRTALHQNYPNPFNPSTIIRYDIADAGKVNLRIYDVSGALVKVLERSHHDPGRYEVGWNGDNEAGQNVSSGVYFYQLMTKEFTQTKKMLLLK